MAALSGLAGCERSAEPKAAAASQGKPAWTLNESTLTAPIRFSAADLDPAQGACDDFSGYANTRWLAANPIPGDKTSWGPFDVLELRSLGIQRQLAERAAIQAAPAGIDKIVADFWGSGMDEARVNAQGLSPLKDRLAAIDSLRDGAGSRRLPAQGRRATARTRCSSSSRWPDFKNSSMNIAYAMQGGLSLPDKTYYFDADKKPIREAFEKHVARVLELSGIPGDRFRGRRPGTYWRSRHDSPALRNRPKTCGGTSPFITTPRRRSAADKLTPNFPWTAVLRGTGHRRHRKCSPSAIPAFHREVDRMLADVPVAQWQSYLRYHLVDERLAVPE